MNSQNNNIEIKTHRMTNAPMGLVPFGIDEVANAPLVWTRVNQMIAQLSATTIKTGKNGEVKSITYTIPSKTLKTAIKEVNRLLKAQGLKPIMGVSSKPKEQLIDELDLVCYQQTEMYGITAKKNEAMRLTHRTLGQFAKAGLLTPELGASTRLVYAKKLEAGSRRGSLDQVTTIALTGHSGKDKKNWVNSATETEGFVGSEALSGFGTFTEERFTCDLNAEAASLADMDYANCTSVNGVVGYAKKGKNTCQLCGGPATVSFPRWSVSTKNGTFAAMPFIRMVYGTPFKTIPTTSATVIANKDIMVLEENRHGDQNDDGTTKMVSRREAIRVKATSIQPRLYPVHLQGKGGRVARKINGSTKWVDVYFQQLVFEAENGQNFAVWCAVECTGNETKKLHQIFTPSPSEASVIVSNAFMNNDDLSFLVATKVHYDLMLNNMIDGDTDRTGEQAIPDSWYDSELETDKASCTCSNPEPHFICDVEDGAGVV